jgi:hypothetical protein
VDSVVAIVGNTAIKHSDVIRDLRMTAFLNKAAVNLDQKLQEETMNRLIDQALIRNEIQAGSYDVASAALVDAAVKPVQASYGGPAAFQAALQRYGVSEEELRQRLQWEITALDFTQLRFGDGGAGHAEAQAGDSPGTDTFVTWLDSTRKNARIVTKPERLK